MVKDPRITLSLLERGLLSKERTPELFKSTLERGIERLRLEREAREAAPPQRPAPQPPAAELEAMSDAEKARFWSVWATQATKADNPEVAADAALKAEAYRRKARAAAKAAARKRKAERGRS